MPLYRVLEKPLDTQELLAALQVLCPPGMHAFEISMATGEALIVIGDSSDEEKQVLCIRLPHAKNEPPGHFVVLAPNFADLIVQRLPGRLQRMWNCTPQVMQVK